MWPILTVDRKQALARFKQAITFAHIYIFVYITE